MYQEPNKSPWGVVQTCDTLCPGVFLVSTASHGGTMVSNEVAAFLSPAANPAGVFFFRRLLRLPFPACFTACFTSLFTDLFALRAYATIARYIGNHERRNRKHNRQRRQQ